MGVAIFVNQIDSPDKDSGKIKIATSFFTVSDVISKIAGDKIELTQIIPNNAEVHSYEPTPRQIASLEKNVLFFFIGNGIEPWVVKMNNILQESGVRTIELSHDLELLKYSSEELHDKEEDDDEHDGHDHHEISGEYDPHVWLDPLNMKTIAAKVKDELIKIDSNNSGFYEKNYRDYVKKIDELHKEYQDTLINKKQNYILVSHAAFGYLGRRYGFEQLSVTGITPHEEPAPGNLARLARIAKEKGFKYIFMETLATPRTVTVLAEEVDLEVLELNTISGLTKEEEGTGEDYFSLMKKNLLTLKKALVD